MAFNFFKIKFEWIVYVISLIALILTVTLWFFNPNRSAPFSHPALQWFGIGVFVMGVLRFFVENPGYLIPDVLHDFFPKANHYKAKIEGDYNIGLIILGILLWALSR